MLQTTESCYLVFQIVMNVMVNGTQPSVVNRHLWKDLFIYFLKGSFTQQLFNKTSG